MNVRAIFILSFLIEAIICGCGSESYTFEMEPSGTKVIKGVLHRNDLEEDSLFTWFKANYQSYTPDAAAIKEIEPLVKDVHFFLVLGTWCGDSKREVPKMFKVFDAMDISKKKIELFGVDRSKRSQDGTTDKYNVQRIPTLLVFRGEQEIGRIVENPRDSQEKDLLRILQR
ncbi:MAG: thioredoxin family protein [Bacteroidota bacterium]